jgi:hypothetical protein
MDVVAFPNRNLEFLPAETNEHYQENSDQRSIATTPWTSRRCDDRVVLADALRVADLG